MYVLFWVFCFFVFFCVLFVCTVLLPWGVNPTAVNKVYVIQNRYVEYTFLYTTCIRDHGFLFFLKYESYGCVTWSLTLKEERRLRVSENSVLR
jgi:hypothetical protein